MCAAGPQKISVVTGTFSSRIQMEPVDRVNITSPRARGS